MKKYLLISAFLLFGFCCFGLGITLGGWIGPIKSHKSDAIEQSYKDDPKTYQIAGAGYEGPSHFYPGGK
jgi:hypothetical protein